MIQDLLRKAYLDGYAKGEKCDWVKPQSAKESMANDYAEKQVKNLTIPVVINPLNSEFVKWRDNNFTKIQVCKYRRNDNHKSIIDDKMLIYAYKDYLITLNGL